MFTMIPYRPMTENRPQYPICDDFFRPFFGRPMERSFKVDVKDSGDSYTLEAELPGVEKDNIEIGVENDVLTISVRRDDKKEDKDPSGYVIRERRMGRASRSFSVEGIRQDDITAQYVNGVLTLTLPKEKDEAAGRRAIAIA